MAEDVAKLGLEVDSSSVKSAGVSLRDLEVAAKRAGVSVEEMRKRVENASDNIDKMRQRSNEASKAVSRVRDSLNLKIAALTMSNRELAVYNALTRAGVTADTVAGQQIRQLALRHYELAEAKRRASAATTGLTRALGPLGTAITTLLSYKGIKDVVEQVAKLGENAELVGYTARNLQVLRYAVIQVGGASQDADKGLQVFVKNLGEAATGQGYLYRLLRENNVQFKDRSVIKVWSDFLDILRRAPDEATRLRMASRALGEELGPKFAKLAAQGPEALQEAYADLQKAGAGLTEEQIRNAKRINDEWTKLEFLIGQRVKGAIVDAGSATSDLVKEFNKLPPWLQKVILGNPLEATWTIGKHLLSSDASNVPANLPRVNVNTNPRLGAVAGTSATRPSRDPGTRDITNEYTRLQKSLEKQVVSLKAEAETYGQGEYAIEKYRVQQQLLLAAEQAKLKMSPELRKQIEGIADAYGKAAENAAKIKLRTDLAFEQGQLGRSDIEASVASRLRSAGLPVDLQSTEANLIRINEQLRISKDLSTDFALDFGRTLREELRSGASAWEAFQKAGMNALTRLTDKLMDMAISNLVAKAFGGATGGFNLFSLFGSSGSSAGSSIGASVFHQGTLSASRGSNARYVHPAYFDDAPRYHNGTPGAGIGPDEVPAILKRGEPVFKSMDQARQMFGGGGKDVHVTVETFVNENGNWDAKVTSIAQRESGNAVREYDKVLPDRHRQIAQNPRRR